ncbi:hypothetical protein PN836_006860 [Ningiella sp. W23]|uniref:hypothetical protein n=1 Tax=Ningiella sp. W23 TaxID=3023715 RepID=UPI0037573F67
MNLKKLFKRRHPYAPVAYLGRKTVERSLNADILKLKELDRELAGDNKKGASL